MGRGCWGRSCVDLGRFLAALLSVSGRPAPPWFVPRRGDARTPPSALL